jgi:hypothetical protein
LNSLVSVGRKTYEFSISEGNGLGTPARVSFCYGGVFERNA